MDDGFMIVFCTRDRITLSRVFGFSRACLSELCDLTESWFACELQKHRLGFSFSFLISVVSSSHVPACAVY